MSLKKNLLAFAITLVIIAVVAFFGPEEKSLGSNVRIVYLHGAWVLAALTAFIAAGLVGLAGLALHFAASLRRPAWLQSATLLRWSQTLGWTGLAFWLTYLPMSLWAMQANWNGLFLSEPRFRAALGFAVTGLLLQAGLLLLGNLSWTAIANALYIAILWLTLRNTSYIMHPPPSPIFNSGIVSIQVFFVVLDLLVILAAWFLNQVFLKFRS